MLMIRVTDIYIYIYIYILPVAEEAVKAKNEIFFVGGDLAALDGWTEIVHPAETAALAAA
jgi:hypothetical protein